MTTTRLLVSELALDQPVDLVAIDKRLAAISTEIRDAVRAHRHQAH